MDENGHDIERQGGMPVERQGVQPNGLSSERQLERLIEKARRMLAEGSLDEQAYGEVENFVLKNGSRLAGDARFEELQELAGRVAQRYGLPSVTDLQESFGANSCAQ